MSGYSQRLTLIVPGGLLGYANQLALLIGESADDINTFSALDWVDAYGNTYAVCSTVTKPSTIEVLDQALIRTHIPDHAGDVDLALAQRALDLMVLVGGGINEPNIPRVTPDAIYLLMGDEPLKMLAGVGVRIAS